MNDFSAFLCKYHKQTKVSDAKSQETIKAMKKTCHMFQLPFSASSDKEYYRLEIIMQGIANKQTLESSYDRIRNELIELWDHVDYQQRNALMTLHQSAIKESLTLFITDTEAKIYIPFFDELINTLYGKEMVVFELPQFFKLYKDFKSTMVDVWKYRYLPYQHGFTTLTFVDIDVKKQEFVLFDEALQMLYHVLSDGTWISYPMDMTKMKLGVKDASILARYLFNRQIKYFAGYLISVGALSKKCHKSLLKQMDTMINQGVSCE